VLDRRRAGVLLHPSSLPTGDFGPDAHRFLDFMHDAGLSVWQMLPLAPTHDDGSPYHALSAHALSPRFISVARLKEDHWLEDGAAVLPRGQAISQAHARLGARPEARAAYAAFRERAAGWLEDFALFEALREASHKRSWWDWEPALREREPAALDLARGRLARRIELLAFEQFLVRAQFDALRARARERGILFFGDMPIFVAHDSAEVWAHREQFRLDAGGHPTAVAGVPPDYFSATGQRWGNPLYDWARMQQDGFRWWSERLATELSRFDLVRIDHFRGFEACWEIPASEPTAVHGQWIPAPGTALFDALRAARGALPLVAEDLGIITPEVDALRERYGLPGMLVLQFAFDGGPVNPYLPHWHTRNAVVYTGTHDNDTTRSWFEGLAPQAQLYVVDYLGFAHEPMPWPVIRATLMSVAELAVIPMQDILGLGRGHRMNTPGTVTGNWSWRFDWDMLTPATVAQLKRLIGFYGRAP
jgi:4-alpha-glucanotransferase